MGIKELAKELCTCPHKCKDTTDCVVEEEAREYLPFVLTNEEKVSRKGEWISVEDRLPAYEQQVIALSESGEVTLGIISPSTNEKEYGKYCADNAFECLTFVTHWMPLPEAPKMKGGE